MYIFEKSRCRYKFYINVADYPNILTPYKKFKYEGDDPDVKKAFRGMKLVMHETLRNYEKYTYYEGYYTISEFHTGMAVVRGQLLSEIDESLKELIAKIGVERCREMYKKIVKDNKINS